MARVNKQINAPELRVVGGKGEQLGIMATEKALSLAWEQNLDLIEIAPKAVPPVCKIMDYGKYLYHKAKQDKVQKLKQKKVEIKAVRLSVRTGQHDLDFKTEKVKKFLSVGDKVKIDMLLRGREKQHFNLAEDKLKNFVATLGEIKLEQPLKRTPQGFVVIVSKLEVK